MKQIKFCLLLNLILVTNLFAQRDIETDIKEIKQKMVTREEFKLFVDMVNKRFEDIYNYMDKRFEDVNKRFEDINKMFTIIGTLQGLTIVILGVIGWRVTRYRKEDIELIVENILLREKIESGKK